jgi:hypothetical protein
LVLALYRHSEAGLILDDGLVFWKVQLTGADDARTDLRWLF